MVAVSVVIPVYNVASFLPRCLDSVLNQTFSDWEAVCVNDGSTDASGEILAEYAARDSRIRVITKSNGGLSDARNVGTAAARGDYVLYLDSDDFIHRQTLEITHKLATQENADVVAFRYDRAFHKKLSRMLSRGEDIRGLLPAARSREYNANKVAFRVTDDMLKYATERNHKIGGRWQLRHCFPVLYLYRRELIADLPFIRGIIMEDFPWYCSMMLRRPRTVITNLPLYFYMPNPASILNSSKALRMVESIATGVGHVYGLYSRDASPREMRRINREFLWPFIITAMRKTGEITNKLDVDMARRGFENLAATGALDNPPNRRARKYRRRIFDFVNEK